MRTTAMTSCNVNRSVPMATPTASVMAGSIILMTWMKAIDSVKYAMLPVIRDNADSRTIGSKRLQKKAAEGWVLHFMKPALASAKPGGQHIFAFFEVNGRCPFLQKLVKTSDKPGICRNSKQWWAVQHQLLLCSMPEPVMPSGRSCIKVWRKLIDLCGMAIESRVMLALSCAKCAAHAFTCLRVAWQISSCPHGLECQIAEKIHQYWTGMLTAQVRSELACSCECHWILETIFHQ